MKPSHLLSYLSFLISFIFLGLIIFKLWNEPKETSPKVLVEKIEKQKTDINKMSKQVVKMACELKNKRTDTIQIIKNKDVLIVETKENKVIINDTIIQYVDRVDTIFQDIAKVDTIIMIKNDEFQTTSKKRFCLRCK